MCACRMLPRRDEGFCEWPSNLVVDNASTEVDLFARPLSPQSMQDEEDKARNSVNVVSLDATDCTSRTISPPPNRESSLCVHSSLTPRLQGISVTWCGTVR